MAETKTSFASVYNRFLGKITDDMYIEFTVEDTVKDLQNLLVDAIPGFEFPRVNLYDYEIKIETVKENEVLPADFVLGVLWKDLPENDELQVPDVIVDRSVFNIALSNEEINILALIMKQSWVQRQVASIENTRMKYAGSDFKMGSQANHLDKLLKLLDESRRDSFHMQRLYKRRKVDTDGVYQSTWRMFRSVK